MSSTYGTDIHRIYIFFADKSGNIFYIVILLFFRNNGCNNTGKTTAMNTAYTCTDFFQEKLCQRKGSCDLLLMEIFHGVAVLQKFPGRSS